MAKEPWIEPSVTKFVHDYVKKHGGDADKAIAQAGLTLDEISDGEGLIPYVSYARVFELAAEELDEPNFGFHIGLSVEQSVFGAISFLMMSSHTLRTVLKNWSRFENAHNDAYKVEFVEEDDVARIRHHAARPSFDAFRHEAEFSDAALIRMLRSITGVHIVPVEMRFTHANTGNPAELEEFFFRLPRLYDQKIPETVIDAKLLDLKVKSADEGLADILATHCEHTLRERSRKSPDIVTQVERHVVRLLSSGDAKASVVAAELALSERTLARRLADAGTSFNGILDGLRKDIAMRYLNQPDLDLIEVAFLLGYGNQSAFTNAVKRWTGTTPKQLRLAYVRKTMAGSNG
ncbi:MAG: AraC family transcriptional regulator [Hyphomicrobiales bacterium]